MGDPNDAQLTRALSAFAFEGKASDVVRTTAGHIHHTYLVTAESGAQKRRFTLQRINKYVFTSPQRVMENISAVTDYLRTQLAALGDDPSRGTINIVKTHDGKSFFLDSDGEYWRLYSYIENTFTLQRAQNPRELFEAAHAFGRFQLMLCDYPAKTLNETIPHFHDPKSRMQQLKAALAADEYSRSTDVAHWLSVINAHSALLEKGEYFAGGVLPLRVTHNDTKLNNVLLDDKTGRAVCVIDLDTIMPGLSIYDFGDGVRCGASSAEEDETDLSLVTLDMTLFEAYTAGYLSALGDNLTPAELEALPAGAQLIALELGIRFLTDYLNGDKYFHTEYPCHNLDRAANQLTLLLDMEKKQSTMEAIIEKIRRK